MLMSRLGSNRRTTKEEEEKEEGKRNTDLKSGIEGGGDMDYKDVGRRQEMRRDSNKGK